MSKSPKGLGLKLPTLAGNSAAVEATATQFLQFAMPGWSSAPHQYFVCVPPRAAYSHSASLGRRKGLCVTSASQAQKRVASFPLTFVTGASSSPVAVKAQALAAAHSFHCRTVTGYFAMAKGLIVT